MDRPNVRWLFDLLPDWRVVFEHPEPPRGRVGQRHVWAHPGVEWYIIERGGVLRFAANRAGLNELLAERDWTPEKFDVLEQRRLLQVYTLKEARRLVRRCQLEPFDVEQYQKDPWLEIVLKLTSRE